MNTLAFKDIVGQEFPIKFIRNIIQSGQVGHAYLFHGPDGVGKKTLAKRFAMALLCSNPLSVHDACAECPNCNRFISNSHPNFQFLQKEGQYNYKIEQLREFRKNTFLKAYQADRRIYLISELDKMQPDGANSLLKTLEEPGADIILLLITSNLQQVLPTIISRAQLIRCNRLPNELIEKILIDKIKIPPDIARLTAILSEGSVGKSIELSNPIFSKIRKDILTQLIKHQPGNLSNCFILAKTIFDYSKSVELDKTDDKKENKLAMVTVYDWLLYWFRDLMVYRYTKNDKQLINQDFANEIKMIFNQWSWSSLRVAIQQLEYIKSITIKNINPTFALESVFLRAYQNQSKG